jgi:hypothetical protein
VTVNLVCDCLINSLSTVFQQNYPAFFERTKVEKRVLISNRRGGVIVLFSLWDSCLGLFVGSLLSANCCRFCLLLLLLLPLPPLPLSDRQTQKKHPIRFQLLQ